MTQSDLSEIQARCDAGRPIRRIDVKALLDEVKRLQAERDEMKKALEMALTDLDYHTGYSERENVVIRNEAIYKYVQQAKEAMKE